MAHTTQKDDGFDWNQARTQDGIYLSQQKDRRNKSQMGSFHNALNAIDSGLMFTQTSGDTISTTKDAVATAARTTSILGHTILGIGDPLMMLSIGLRAAFGFVRALVDKGIEARKTRLATSFLNMGLATLAVVMVFGVIATAPAFSIPLCLLGATLFGYYSDYHVITEKKRRLAIAKEAWITLDTENQIHQLLRQREQLLKQHRLLSSDPSETNEVKSMMDTINTEIKDLCIQDHEQQAKLELDKNIIICMTRSKNARMIGALGIVLIIASIFTFPPFALIGFALFITAGIVNGFIRRQQYQHEAKYDQAIHDQNAVDSLEKTYIDSYNNKKINNIKLKYHESEAVIDTALVKDKAAHPHPIANKNKPEPTPDNVLYSQGDSISHIFTDNTHPLFHEKHTREEDEGEGERMTDKKLGKN